MALNISYAAWAVIFALVLQGTVPTSLQVVCCIVALTGTVLAASPDWRELRLTRPSAGRTADGFSKKAAERQDDGTDRDAALRPRARAPENGSPMHRRVTPATRIVARSPQAPREKMRAGAPRRRGWSISRGATYDD